MMKLTEQAHIFIKKSLYPGSKAIDATMGHGHDTAFLANCVGINGLVYAFDVQERALQSTQKRLKAANIHLQVILNLKSHEAMLDVVPSSWVGATNTIVFNLGYLPHSDKTCITQKATTSKALKASYMLLAPGGILSIMLYAGHSGGEEEANGVREWVQRMVGLGQLKVVKDLKSTSSNPLKIGPQWICVSKNG